MLENNCRRAFRCCIDIVIFIISILLTFVIGVLVGGATELATVIGTGGFIVLITVFVPVSYTHLTLPTILRV